VQVSQGLVQGNLTTRPTANYQGEFVRIKDSLETVLSNQHLVIADIVQISQELKNGNLNINLQAEYKGDFAKIQNSLETSLTN